MTAILNLPPADRPRVVILGCGFGGLSAAKGLRGSGFQVVIIDKNNYHTFQPLLYQVATGGIEPGSIAYPIRKIFRGQKDFHYRLAYATGLSCRKNILYTDHGEVEYDYLVIATGSRTNFFGMTDFAERGLPMKSVKEALDLRTLILGSFEETLLHPAEKGLTNFLVVGGGPTGVELAGALAEFRKRVLPADYPELNPHAMQIHLVEMVDRVLPSMSAAASREARRFLESLGVTVWLQTKVTSFDGHDVVFADGRTLPCKSVIWTAGIKGTLIGGLPPEAVTRGCRIAVDDFNRVKGTNNVFAIGDTAAMSLAEYPKGLPMTAPAAIQQGLQVAKNLRRISAGKSMQAFKFKDRGSLATIGRDKAVADLPWFKFQGRFAWLMWVAVHIWQLIGFRNKVVTLTDWAWNYATYDRNVRLILPPLTIRAREHPLMRMHCKEKEEEKKTEQRDTPPPPPC